MLPPFGLSAVVTQWQFAPVVTGVVVVLAALSGWGVIRVARKHPIADLRWTMMHYGSFYLRDRHDWAGESVPATPERTGLRLGPSLLGHLRDAPGVRLELTT